MSGVTTNQAQHVIDGRWNAKIAVIEHGRGVEQHLEHQDCDGRRSDGPDHRELDDHRQENFHRMKAQPGGDVEFEVGVVHAMQTPQHWHRVKEDVLQIDREVEDDYGEDDR